MDKALKAGARRASLFRVRWNIAGDCEKPYTTEVHGRPERGRPSDPQRYKRYRIVAPGLATPGVLEIETRCRRCGPCLALRSRRWRGAALAETRASSRTWFGTLTLSPEHHFRFFAKASNRLANQGVDLDRLTEREQFLERHREISPELTKYIKRFRKNKPGLRYLLVLERHKSGLPHYHMLVHEAPLGGIVTHRELSSKWDFGFERWRLSDPQNPMSAVYLCKYLSKAAEARVRASQGYGVTTSYMHTHVIDQLLSIDRVNFSEIDQSEPDW